jgi:hypothetical protein
MDPPPAVEVAPATIPAVPRQQRGRRGRTSRLVEFTLHFAISYAILSLLRFEPLARNSVQEHNYGIDLPSKPETMSGEVVHQISTRSTRISGKIVDSVTSLKQQEINMN